MVKKYKKFKTPSPKFIPRLTFWANKKITAPEKIRFRKYGKKVSFTATKKECRHKWIIGAGIGGIEKGKIKSIGLYIRCEKCNKIIKAYYYVSSIGKIKMLKRYRTTHKTETPNHIPRGYLEGESIGRITNNGNI